MKSKKKSPLISGMEIEREAIAFLQKHAPEQGYLVRFSGGKDSIVIEHLCRLAGVKYAATYSCTTIDPPEIVRFIRTEYPHVEFLYPQYSFWEGIKKYGPACNGRRWCCSVLKESPARKHPLARFVVLGIRAEESIRRQKQQRISQDGKSTLYRPILYWNEYHVWDFIERHKLPYPALYDEGFDRIGCVICPLVYSKNQTKRLRNYEKWPKLFAVFEKVARKWFEQKQKDGELLDYEFEQWLDGYYHGETHLRDDEPLPQEFKQGTMKTLWELNKKRED